MSEQSSAKDRYIKHYQTTAVGVNPHADLEQVLRADKLVAEGAGGYKIVQLQGHYGSDDSHDPALGNCVRRAIREFINVDVDNLPSWLRIEDLKEICQELDLVLFDDSQVLELSEGEQVIMIYQTREKTAHAVIVSTQLEMSKIEGSIVAVIRTSK